MACLPVYGGFLDTWLQASAFTDSLVHNESRPLLCMQPDLQRHAARSNLHSLLKQQRAKDIASL